MEQKNQITEGDRETAFDFLFSDCNRTFFQQI